MYDTGIPQSCEIIIIRHDLECEMGHFDPKVYIFMSEARLAKFQIKENQRVGLSHPTLLTIIDFSHYSSYYLYTCLWNSSV
jgi:hypothetical protein